jgi:hypothetical protein
MQIIKQEGDSYSLVSAQNAVTLGDVQYNLKDLVNTNSWNYLNALGYYKYIKTPQPSYDSRTQDVSLDGYVVRQDLTGGEVWLVSEKPLQAAKDNSLEYLKTVHAQWLTNIIGTDTQEEKDTWTRKLQAAKGYMSGSPTDSDMYYLSLEADQTGETVQELVTLILTNDAKYGYVVGTFAGIRRSGAALVRAATTNLDVRDAVELTLAKADVATQQIIASQS